MSAVWEEPWSLNLRGFPTTNGYVDIFAAEITVGIVGMTTSCCKSGYETLPS